ncbi:MAG: YdcH family protein [Lautropia sp.]
MSAKPQDIDALKLRIAELQLEHRGLHQMIERMAADPDSDQLALRRLKKRKLQIKDTIVLLQMQLTPDVPA